MVIPMMKESTSAQDDHIQPFVFIFWQGRPISFIEADSQRDTPEHQAVEGPSIGKTQEIQHPAQKNDDRQSNSTGSPHVPDRIPRQSIG